jgi:hypothetical protein
MILGDVVVDQNRTRTNCSPQESDKVVTACVHC